MARNNDQRPLVFLDTNVLVEYLRGGVPESHLLSDKMLQRFRFAINPVVLSELLLAADTQRNSGKLQHIQDSLKILPINDAELSLLADRLRRLRNGVAHSNDILIFSSAANCDYLLTRDEAFKKLQEAERPVILTTEEFLQEAEHA